MSYYEEVTKDLDATLDILTGIAKDLKDWKPLGHTKVISKGKNKGKCKDCGLSTGL